MAGSHGQQHQAAIQRKICTSTTVLLDYHDGTGAAFPFSTAFLGSGKTTRTEEVEQSDMEGSFSLHTLAIEEKLDLTVAGLRAGWHGSLVPEILAPRRFLPGLLIDFLNPRNRQKWPHPSLLKFLIETNRQTVNRLASQRSEVVGLSFQRRSSTSKVSRRNSSMRTLSHSLSVIVLTAFAVAVQAQEWKAPTEMKRLANGLTVVVSEDHSAPTFGVCVSYGIGFRLEPQGRSGFAHLFEHMMFEGTPVAPKGVFDRVIEGGGGFNNGDTRYDFTEYIESGPISALEPMLWLEADRMKTLDFSVKNLDNQRSVVEEEVRVN